MKSYVYKFTFSITTPAAPFSSPFVSFPIDRLVLGDCMKTALNTFELAYPPLEHNIEIASIDNLGQLADSNDNLDS